MISSVGTRIFGYVTLLSCLVVGTAVVRMAMPNEAVITIDRGYLDSAKSLKFEAPVAEKLLTPEIAFNDIKFPVEKKIEKRIVRVARTHTIKVEKKVVLEQTFLEANELPFSETITLSRIEFNNELVTNNIALFKEVTVEELVAVNVPAASSVVEDQVQTQQSQAKESVSKTGDEKAAKISADEDKELEDMFFEYPSTPAAKADEPVLAADTASTPVAEEVIAPQITEQNLKQVQIAEKSATSPEKVEEVSINDLVAFDYSGANLDIKNNAIPTVSAVTTQPSKTHHQSPSVKPATQKSAAQEETMSEALTSSSNKTLKKTATHSSSVTIQLTSTDLKKPQIETNFEVRFQDDLTSIHEDYGSGSVTLTENLSQARMTRSTTILKRGFTPTNNDLIVEAGEATLSIPVIEQETFNELMRPYGSRGSIGAVLVEMDDKTDDAMIDASFGEVITLDGDLKRTAADDYRYKLFIGVRAGNALLSYKSSDRQVVSRIIHVHEHEVTFDANLYDNVDQLNLDLKEEELLSKDKSPLIAAADSVKIFATNKSAKKINDHTYGLDFGKSLLGSRQYVELNHQAEPIFVGVKDNKSVSIPSENFMRHVVRTIEGGNLANHCVVQVNLSKKIDKAFVGTESVNESVMAYTQMLDSDGKFYDSPSDKTRKLIIVGESQGSEDASRDAKINVKINYVDGSVEYLGSYCSPNTYLVEQL